MKTSRKLFEIVKSVNMRSCKGRSLLVYDADESRNIVLDERRRELMFEGKRWYDDADGTSLR